MSPFTEFYEKGLAVGVSDVKHDAMIFRFRDEQFTLTTLQACKAMKWNGRTYEMPIAKLRGLLKKK